MSGLIRCDNTWDNAWDNGVTKVLLSRDNNLIVSPIVSLIVSP